MREGTVKKLCTSCPGMHSPENLNGDECSTLYAATNLWLNVGGVL